MTPDVFRTYARYNAWMNDNIYAGCAKIPDAQRKKDMGAFFKSIYGTLNHLLLGDRFWMARFTGQALPGVSLDAILYKTLPNCTPRAARWIPRSSLSQQA